jgi:hypothetical protein
LAIEVGRLSFRLAVEFSTTQFRLAIESPAPHLFPGTNKKIPAGFNRQGFDSALSGLENSHPLLLILTGRPAVVRWGQRLDHLKRKTLRVNLIGQTKIKRCPPHLSYEEIEFQRQRSWLTGRVST